MHEVITSLVEYPYANPHWCLVWRWKSKESYLRNFGHLKRRGIQTRFLNISYCLCIYVFVLGTLVAVSSSLLEEFFYLCLAVPTMLGVRRGTCLPYFFANWGFLFFSVRLINESTAVFFIKLTYFGWSRQFRVSRFQSFPCRLHIVEKCFFVPPLSDACRWACLKRLIFLSLYFLSLYF